MNAFISQVAPSTHVPQAPSMARHGIVTRSKSRSYVNALWASTVDIFETKNITLLCMKRPHEALQKDIEALHEKATCTFTFLPPGCTLVGSKCNFKVKRKADGTME